MTTALAGTGRRLTDAEALMWVLDRDAALRSAFMGITFLDRPPDRARFERRMVEALDGVPALRWRVGGSPLDIVRPSWEPDPGFDLANHLHWVRLPRPGTPRQLLDLAAALYAEPFDRSRPLWQFTVVEGLQRRGAALLAKMDHVLSDGIGAVRVSVSFLDLTPDGEGATPPSRRPAPPTSARPVWLAPLSAVGSLAGTVGGIVRSPATQLQRGATTVTSLGRQLGVIAPARSPLWTERSFEPHFETLSLDLDALRGAARALGGSVNDAYVTIMAAAAGSYHRALGSDVAELRMTMPVSVRHDHDAGGNAWVPTRVLVPTGPMAPAARFEEVSRRLTAVKHESLDAAASFAGVARLVPRPLLFRVARQQVRTVDFACSNVRGAPFDLWIAGAHVEANHPMGPTAGVAFNATVLSYKDSLDLGLNTDTGAIAEPDRLVECIRDAAAELARATGTRPGRASAGPGGGARSTPRGPRAQRVR